MTTEGMELSHASGTTAVPSLGLRNLLPITLAAGTIAGVVGWIVWEAVSSRFSPRGEVIMILGTPQTIISVDGRMRAGIRGASASAGIMGALLGLGLGLAGGFAKRSSRAALVAGATGATIGAIAGILSARILIALYYRYEDPISGDLLLPLATQGGVWMVVGAAAGIALGLGLGGLDRTIRAGLGGLLGAAIGAVAFQAIGAYLFPNDETDQPLSASWLTRLLLRLLVAALAATCATLAVQTGRHESTKELPARSLERT